MKDLSGKIIMMTLLCFCALFPKQSFSQSMDEWKTSSRKDWITEAEGDGSTVEWRGDTAEIYAPKGLTLWYANEMRGNVIIEYEATIVTDCKNRPTSQAHIRHEGDDRLSDLNCFWMASDPKHGDIRKRMRERGGRFLNTYSMRLYYMGFGGNYNSTTRFRRYDGDERGIDSAKYRPAILKEYTDKEHLLRPGHWYKIRLECIDGRVRYFIDGERLVDYLEPQPLRSGWFGFRTTLAHAMICGFRYKSETPDERPITLRWIGGKSTAAEKNGKGVPQTFGVPFGKGELHDDTPVTLRTSGGAPIATDSWALAHWPDGSVKWKAFAGLIPADADSCLLTIGTKSEKVRNGHKRTHSAETPKMRIAENESHITLHTGVMSLYMSKGGDAVIDSIVLKGTKTAGKTWLVAACGESATTGNVTTETKTEYKSRVTTAEVEQWGNVRSVVKIEGVHTDGKDERIPFRIRLYCYAGSEEIKMVHTLLIDSVTAEGKVRHIGLKTEVPMRKQPYNRHIAFCGEGKTVIGSDASEGVWRESVQPLVGRRRISVPTSFRKNEHDNTDYSKRNIEELQQQGTELPDYEEFDSLSRFMINNVAQWDGFRLSQLSPESFSIRKKTTRRSPWIGTVEGRRANGTVYFGDTSGGMVFCMKDFWQFYPSSLEVENARGTTATVSLWMWSPEAEAMDFAHYDTVAHSLEASYEDVQPGLSTAYGIAHTTTIYLVPQEKSPDNAELSTLSHLLSSVHQLCCTPEYLHRKRAFGIWSLPDRTTELSRKVENRIDYLIEFYKNSVEQHSWYGFWNYGDFMHTYDAARHAWLYDVGGFAWDNTELGSNAMLWYSFLRSGRADIWTLAEAMTRHTAETDVYHAGPHSGLGSRHNVSHWGCGAKEARISQAFWNRFYYYLTADERTGDLMTEVKDSEQKLYTLDPMRLAQPRSKYPCTAPARLRIGPDWLAYASNWMTEWERTGDTKYRDKIITGMRSVAKMRHGLFSGPKALGFDPATGVITNERDTAIQNTNHLMTIMGGFELMMEMMEMVDVPEWNAAWLDHAIKYKQKALEISRNHFLVPRLSAYAAWMTGNCELRKTAWNDLLRTGKDGVPRIFLSGTERVNTPDVLSPVNENRSLNTNDAATWCLDAIFIQEVLK